MSLITHRLQYACRKHWYALTLPVILAVAYLAVSLYEPHRYVIETRVAIPEQLIAAQSQKPSDLDLLALADVSIGPGANNSPAEQILHQVVTSPQRLAELGVPLAADLHRDPNWREHADVRDFVRSLSVSPEAGRNLVVRYDGANRDAGANVVALLAWKVNERVHMRALARGLTTTPSEPAAVQTTPFRGMPPGALATALLLLLGSLIVVLALLTVAGLLNRTFTSERQLADYLDLPVVGGVPRIEG